jgi:hypothetical protein
MGSPWHQLIKWKNNGKQCVTSKGAQVFQMMAQSKVVRYIFGQFPLFSTENPRFRHIPTMLATTKSQTPCHVMLYFITKNYINSCAFNNYDKKKIQKIITINIQGLVCTATFRPTQEHAIKPMPTSFL